jgi:4-hydroxy-4-methyl-2-oxoglutarate aldolase
MAAAEDAFAILRSMSAATIWEAAGKRGDLSPRIKPLFPEARLAGPAFTVKMFPGETLATVRAVDAAPRGSVIVIDAGAAERGVSWGGTATFAASRKGIAGLVTNGTVRDLAEILERKFPVFATGPVSLRVCGDIPAGSIFRSASVRWWSIPATSSWAILTASSWCLWPSAKR